MPDLFDWTPPPGYPDSPGFKERTTSQEAARKMAPRAGTLRADVMTVYRTAWPAGLTADECAARMGKSILSVRPRVTELRRQGQLVPTLRDGKPDRRANESGLEATVLVCRRPE